MPPPLELELELLELELLDEEEDELLDEELLLELDEELLEDEDEDELELPPDEPSTSVEPPQPVSPMLTTNAKDIAANADREVIVLSR